MSISTEEKDRYLRETAIVLAREGFQTGKTDTGKLRVLLDGAPLCEVTENGGITYRNEDINEPERVAAKDMVYENVRITAEYMRQMETAPSLKAEGLEDGYDHCFSPLSLRANRAYAPISFVFHRGSYKTRKYARNTMYRIV